MRLNIKVRRNVAFPLDVREDSTLADLKTAICSCTGVIPGKQRLFCSGIELLQPLISLGSFGIVDNADVHLVVSTLASYAGSTDLSESQSIPHVCELSPNSGPSEGGQKSLCPQVLIHGKDFPRVPTLIANFGTLSVPAQFISEELLEAYAPSHSPGTVSVEITHDGVHFTNDSVIYTYTSSSGLPFDVPVAVSVSRSLPLPTQSCRTTPIAPLQLPPPL